MTAAVHDTENNPSVISISWGGPEEAATNQFRQNLDQVLQAAAHLGITVCVATGDNASADFPLNDPQHPWDGHAHVDFPASSPFSLACGGTRIIGTAPSANEVVWHAGPNEGTGGGISRVFPVPTYQSSTGVPNAKNPRGRAGRGIPDVAGDAAQESGYRIVCDGQIFPDQSLSPPLPPVGGTSAVAPLWAALIVVINQALRRRVGFVNPALYRLSPASGAFNDITTGDNGDYQAGLGWDPCTGLGVPNGKLLLAALRAQPSTVTPALKTLRKQEADPSLPGRSCVEITSLLRDYFQTTRALIELVTSARAPSTEEPISVRAVSGSCSSKVLYCIGRQSGNADLSSDPQIINVGVQGFALAGCINNTFGLTPPDAFSAADFPPTITVSGCITKVCEAVA